MFTFRGQIISAVRGGAQTLGQIITEPIGGILQGLQTGLEQIPQTFNISFPQFTFTLPTFEFLNAPSLPDPSQPAFGFLPEAGGAMLTPRTGTLPVGPTSEGFVQIQSIADIIAQNPDAVALVDFLATQRVEFFPISVVGITESIARGQQIRISGQLFEEFANIQSVLGAA